MFSFILCIFALILGYIFYGKFIERVFGPDPSRLTPAYRLQDGVDYVPMPTWKVYMIQFLNIAGTGPIFGAIMGAKFGPASYIWIVFGCIFAGAVHDYLSGMASVRNNGAALPDLIGKFLGSKTRKIMLIFIMFLLVLVGAVFVYSPAIILNDMTGANNIKLWIIAIFCYYIIATMVPIDKLIGKIYPIFAVALIFMAVALFVCLLGKWPDIPEIWDGLANRQAELGMETHPIIPCLCITIACGAISGFHATQSPLMARCLKNEKMGRPVFYGSMITEGIIALVWAAVASYFFFDGGAEEVGSTIGAAAPMVVTSVAKSWLGTFGGILALLGVVAAPITSGDTAFRSARLIFADWLKYGQKPIKNRLLISLPFFAIACLILWYNIVDPGGFDIIWRYFGWLNQALSCFTLWMIAVYLAEHKPGMQYLIGLVPAAFMTTICTSYICIDSIGFDIPYAWNIPIMIAMFLICTGLFFQWKHRKKGIKKFY